MAHFQATGKRTLLDVLCRYADHIARYSAPSRARSAATAATRRSSWRWSSWRAHRRAALHGAGRYFMDERGQKPHYFDRRRARAAPTRRTSGPAPTSTTSRICRCASRTRWSATPCGRCTCIAMADLAGENGDAGLLRPAAGCGTPDAKRLYVTGGIGPSAHNEGFTSDYDLPNESAYAETCAAVGLMFWAQRMLQLDRDGRYAECWSWRSTTGCSAACRSTASASSTTTRWPAAATITAGAGSCPCCPPNIARLLASLGSVCLFGRRRASWRCISTGRAASPRQSIGPMSSCVVVRYRGMAMSELTIGTTSAGTLRAAAAHSGLEHHIRCYGEWRGRGGEPARPWLSPHRTGLVVRRSHRAVARDAGASPVGAAGTGVRSRSRRATARAVHLLRRGSRCRRRCRTVDARRCHADPGWLRA